MSFRAAYSESVMSLRVAQTMLTFLLIRMHSKCERFAPRSEFIIQLRRHNNYREMIKPKIDLSEICHFYQWRIPLEQMAECPE